jgi:hypothetical protein
LTYLPTAHAVGYYLSPFRGSLMKLIVGNVERSA